MLDEYDVGNFSTHKRTAEKEYLQKEVIHGTYILLAGQFVPLTSVVRTECCREPHPTLQSAQTMVQNALHNIHEKNKLDATADSCLQRRKLQIITVLGVLVEVRKVANMHIKVYGLVVRRFVGEAEAMDAPLLDYELKLVTNLIARVADLGAIRIFNLPLIAYGVRISCKKKRYQDAKK
jgi:hypothetical protein